MNFPKQATLNLITECGFSTEEAQLLHQHMVLLLEQIKEGNQLARSTQNNQNSL